MQLGIIVKLNGIIVWLDEISSMAITKFNLYDKQTCASVFYKLFKFAWKHKQSQDVVSLFLFRCDRNCGCFLICDLIRYISVPQVKPIGARQLKSPAESCFEGKGESPWKARALTYAGVKRAVSLPESGKRSLCLDNGIFACRSWVTFSDFSVAIQWRLYWWEIAFINLIISLFHFRICRWLR